jgi:multidrug resistance protein, MATE family
MLDTPKARAIRAEVAATLALGWPLVLTNLAQTGLATLDVMLLGRLGPEALAAGTLGANLYFATFIFGIGLASAVAPMAAQAVGRKRHAVRELRRTVRAGLWGVTLVTPPTWLLLWHGEALFLAMGQAPALAREAGRFLAGMLWGTWPMLVAAVLRFFLAAVGRPRPALVVGLLSLPVNLGLALWLMYGGLGVPALGIVGTGLASSLTSALVLAGLVAVVLRDRRLRRYRVLGRLWRGDAARLATVARLGVPIGATLLFEVGLFNGAAFVMGRFGEGTLAAHAVALQVAALCFMVPLGLAQAATVRVGLAYGAGDAAAVGRAGWTALALAAGFMVVVAGLQLGAPRLLIAAFLDVDDPENAAVVRAATVFLALSALFAVADGVQAAAAGMLRGLNDTRVPMALAGAGYWGIGAPLGLALAFGAGLEGVGIWIGLAAGLAVVAVLLVLRWTRRDRLKPAAAPS